MQFSWVSSMLACKLFLRLLCALALLSSVVARASTFKVLYSVAGPEDGTNPYAGMTEIGGMLYGVTSSGVIFGQGIVYRIDPSTGSETLVYTFSGGNDGGDPASALTNVGGMLFGTTYSGGVYGTGTVFKLDPSTGMQTVLHAFGGGSDGTNPASSVIDVGGLLYGVTAGGGGPGDGTVFRIDPASGAETVLYAFQGGSDGQSPTDMIAQGDILYGTTRFGGPSGAGTVFKVDRATGTEAVLCALNSASDGYNPVALTTISSSLFVVVPYGGSLNLGTVLKVDMTTGAQAVVHTFGSGTDGIFPAAALIKVGGTLYGTTWKGGAANLGTVYKLNPATGAESILHAFTGIPDGADPQSSLIYLGGVLYGTNQFGGAYDGGSSFAIDPASHLVTVQHSFPPLPLQSAADGLLSARGAIYFTHGQGGPVNRGAIVKLDPATGASQVVQGFLGANDASHQAILKPQ